MNYAKHDESIHIRLAVLAGILGFFGGGIFSIKTNDVVQIMLYASISGVCVMVFVYFASKLVAVDLPAKKNQELKRGRRIDFTVKD